MDDKNLKRKAGTVLLVTLGLVGFYCLAWVMGYWGGEKPLFSLPELLATIFMGLLFLGIWLVAGDDNGR